MEPGGAASPRSPRSSVGSGGRGRRGAYLQQRNTHSFYFPATFKRGEVTQVGAWRRRETTPVLCLQTSPCRARASDPAGTHTRSRFRVRHIGPSGARGEGGGHCEKTRSAGVNGVWRERGDAGRCLPLIMASAAQNRWRTSTSDEEQLFATPQTGSPRVTLATLPRPLRPPRRFSCRSPAPRSVPPPGQAMVGSGPEAC